MSLLSGDKQAKSTITSVFRDVQFSTSNTSSLKKILTEIYKKTKIEKFLQEFIKCLKMCLLHEEKSANVEKTLDFAAEFAVSFCSDLQEDESCPLLEGVFEFIFENHNCQIQLVRLRICQLMNRLLDKMGHNASVVEETYNKIAESMSVRLKDSMSSVRTQAVYALHRLQSPSDPDCEIITAFKFHMMHDPSHEVRRAVIQKIAVTKLTLTAVLTRLNDVKDFVRKEAYMFINRLLIRQFTIKQRQLILESGLKDRSEMIKEFVIGNLIPNWLKYFNYNYYEFLECIHVEKIPVIGIQLLKTIFEKQHDVILESRIKDMYIADQKISYDKLNIITVVYWRALVEYVKPTDENDKFEHIFEQVIPDLTPFCQYIRGYVFPEKNVNPTLSESVSSEASTNSNVKEQTDSQSSYVPNTGSNQESSQSSTVEKSQEHNTEVSGVHKLDEAVLVHLLEMCKVFDLSDEMGRDNLRQLSVDLLQSTVIRQQSTTAVLASLLDFSVPNTETRLSVMAEIISELREPLQALDSTTSTVPDVLLMEAEEKKVELNDKIKELEAEMEIAQELADVARIQEIKELRINLKKELQIMNDVTPHEPGRNVNNDPETLKKCLTIVVEILKKGNITKMNATLYSLMQNFIIPTLKLRIDGDGAPMIKNLAMQVLGILCVLDVELAKEHFMMFCFNIATESLSVTALKCVFDLLHIYGLSTFNIADPDSVTEVEGDENGQQNKPNLIILLMSLLESESVEMKRTATIGLCKLLFSGRIKSASLVSKLIILWHNPDIENDPHMRQPLGAFFSMFANTCPHAPPLLVQAFLPTLQEMFRLEVHDPLAKIEVESMADLMVNLTLPGYNSHVSKEQSLHNQLAIQICEFILSEEDLGSQQCAVLLKALGHMELNFDLTTDISILNALVARLVKMIPKEDKILHRLVLKIENNLQIRQENNRTISTINNTLPPETRESSSTARTSQLLTVKDSDSEDENQEDEEEEEFSQDMTTLHTIDSSEIVVPGTPETSDSDCDEHSCPSEIKYSSLMKDEEEDFKGFKSQFKGFSPGFKGFKEPSAPPLRTPAKTLFKVPESTPRKAAKTPSKSQDSEISRAPKTPTGGARKGRATTPQNVQNLVKGAEKLNLTPKSDTSQGSSVSERVTRSGRKRKP